MGLISGMIFLQNKAFSLNFFTYDTFWRTLIVILHMINNNTGKSPVNRCYDSPGKM